MDVVKPKTKIRTLGMNVWSVVRFFLVFGLAFLILRPFAEKILMAFMSPDDLLDASVRLIPKQLSTDYWQYALEGLELSKTLLLSVLLAVSVALVQAFIPASIGYGLARFKFRGKNLMFALVIVIMLVPPQTYSIAQYLGFKFFLGTELSLLDTPVPLYLLAFGGLGLKEGLYIYLMMTLFRGLPKDLENAAYIDGSSPIRTFFAIVLPNARTMLVTVFLFGFSWQWTDVSYPKLYFSQLEVISTKVSQIIIRRGLTADPMGSSIAQNAACILIIIPLFLLFLFGQKYFVESISRSGHAN